MATVCEYVEMRPTVSVRVRVWRAKAKAQVAIVRAFAWAANRLLGMGCDVEVDVCFNWTQR